MKFDLPVYQFVIDDSQEAGVKAISIVTDPAFGSSLIAFAKQESKFITFADKKQQKVAGFLILPDFPVYRFDSDIGEYYGYFSKETIAQIVEKYHSEMLQNQVNLNHDDNMFIDAYLIEDYIVDTPERVNDLKSRGLSHPNALGAWYGCFKIKDPEVFKAIEESGTMTGFSIESYLHRVMTDFKSQIKNKLVDNKLKKEMKKINKSLKEKILSIFAELEKFERMLVPELAFEIEWSEVGQPVNKVIVDENGNETLQPLGQGEFTTDAGIVVVDEQSNLVEVRELPMEDSPEVPITSDETSVTGDTETLAEDCITNWLTLGYTQIAAEKICAYIDENNINGEDLTDEQILEIIGEEELAKRKLAEETTVVDDQTDNANSGNTTTVTEETEMVITGDTPTVAPTNGLNKTISELCPAQGEYIISVVVDANGIITEAIVTSQTDLIPSQDTEMPEIGDMNGFSNKVKTLYSRVKELKLKMKEPITDPILNAEDKPVDLSKMTPYERMMYKKGLKPV